MDIKIREYTDADADAVMKIWNQVVDDGVAFPRDEELTTENANVFSTGKPTQELPKTVSAER